MDTAVGPGLDDDVVAFGEFEFSEGVFEFLGGFDAGDEVIEFSSGLSLEINLSYREFVYLQNQRSLMLLANNLMLNASFLVDIHDGLMEIRNLVRANDVVLTSC